MSKRIEAAFNTIDQMFEKETKKHEKELEQSKIKPIHPLFPFAQNGICAMIAMMGSGKSYNYTKFIAKQEVLFDDPFYELVCICSTSAKFDRTVETFKPLIRKSKLVVIADSDLLDFLNVYMKRMQKYNALVKFVNDGFKNPSEEIQQMIQKHHLTKKDKLVEYISKKFTKYGWKTHPHRMLLILDDFASHPLLRSKESEMSRLLKKLRHFFINVIICVQTCKSIPKDIKRLVSDVVLFPGLSKDDFYELIEEGPFGQFDKKPLFEQYRKLENPHDMFKIHLAAKKVVIKYYQE
jgi:hypothetical protein